MNSLNNVGYPYSFILHGRSKTFIWIDGGDDHDFFLRDRSGEFFVISEEQKIQTLSVDSDHISIRWEDEATLDLDKFFVVIRRLNHLVTSNANTRKLLLAGWNFLEDLAFTLELPRHLRIFDDTHVEKMYHKLVFGNNLPSLTPDGKIYIPVWTKLEVQRVKIAVSELWELILTKERIWNRENVVTRNKA